MDQHDLLASHRIISLLEESKESSEVVIDEFPGIYAIFDESFSILRGNYQLSNYFHCSHEELLQKDFLRLFKVNTAETFKSLINKVQKIGHISFELMIDSEERDISYFWTVKRIKMQKMSKKRLFCIVGNNISELKDKEKKLSQIFANIPLGIMVLGRKGEIEEEFSHQTFDLLRTNEIAGKNIKELLFGPSWTELLKKEKLAINNLLETVGKELDFFQSYKDNLPQQIFFSIPELAEKGRYLELSYSPLVYNEIIRKILIVIQDKTQIVLSKKIEEKVRILEDETIARLVQIKRCDSELLNIFMEEIQGLFKDLDEVLEGNDPKKLYTTLHTLKGSARTAGFKFLTNFIHNLETILTKMMNSERIDWAIIKLNVREIKNEWHLITSLYETIILKYENNSSVQDKGPFNDGDEVKNKLLEMYKNLMSKDQDEDILICADRVMLAIKNSKFFPIESIEPLISAKVRETAKALGKDIELRFDWNRVRIDEKMKKDLNSCFIHLLTNALDHGIETNEERLSSGKMDKGKIHIKTWEDGDIIYCTIKDNGRGLAVDKIRKKALEKKLITPEEVKDLKDEQIIQFIFRQGFSTSDNVTEISGRGVGLDAVHSIIKDLMGSIHAENNKEGGATFSFNFVTEKRIKVKKKYYAISSLTRNIEKRIEYLNKQGLKVAFEGFNQGPECSAFRGIIYCDLEKITLSLTTYIGKLADKMPVAVKLGQKDNQLFCQIRGKLGEEVESHSEYPHEERIEYSISIPSCEDFINQHSGQIKVEDNSVLISFGSIFPLDKVPCLSVGTNFALADAKYERTLQEFREVAESYQLKYKIHENTKLNMHIYIEDNFSGESGVLTVPVGAQKKVIEEIFFQSINILLRGEEFG